MGSLPLPPPPPAGVPGPSNPGPTPPPNGALPYRQSALAQVGNGIGDFMKSFIAMRQASKQMHENQFQEGLNALANGVPMSDKGLEKLMKHGVKAGHDWLATEPPTPDEIQYADQTKQKLAAQEALSAVPPQQANPIQQGPAGSPVGDPATAALLQNSQQAAQMNPQQPQPQQQGPRIMQNIGRAFGIGGPQVGAQSQMGNYLKQISAAAQASGGAPGMIRRQGQAQINAADLNDLDTQFEKQFGVPTKQMSSQNAQALMKQVQAAFNGDTNARENLARMTGGKEWMLPMDTYKQVMRAQNPGMPQEDVDKKSADMFQYLHMGGMQYQQFMFGMAKDLAPNFQNNPYSAMQWLSDPQHHAAPAMSSQQFEQYMTGADKLYKAYPTAPVSLIQQIAATYTMPNGDQYRPQLLSQLNGKDGKGNPLFPRDGTEEARMSREKLGPEWYRVGDEAKQWRANLEYNKVKSLADIDQQKWNKMWDLATKDPTSDATNAAIEDFANLRDKDSKLGYDINGQHYSIDNPQEILTNYFRGGWFLSGKNYIQPKQASDSIMQSILGNPNLAPQSVLKWAAQTSNMPDGRDKLSAMAGLIHAVQGLPKEQRVGVLDRLKPKMDPETFDAAQQAIQIDIPGMNRQLSQDPPPLQ